MVVRLPIHVQVRCIYMNARRAFLVGTQRSLQNTGAANYHTDAYQILIGIGCPRLKI